MRADFNLIRLIGWSPEIFFDLVKESLQFLPPDRLIVVGFAINFMAQKLFLAFLEQGLKG